MSALIVVKAMSSFAGTKRHCTVHVEPMDTVNLISAISFMASDNCMLIVSFMFSVLSFLHITLAMINSYVNKYLLSSS